MNWITTNIRLPEDVYMELKMEAAKRRISTAQIVRERITAKKSDNNKKEIKRLMKDMDKFAIKMAKATKGVSLSKALIEMRYEQ